MGQSVRCVANMLMYVVGHIVHSLLCGIRCMTRAPWSSFSAQGGMLLSASYVVLWFTQHVWDYAVEVQPTSLHPSMQPRGHCVMYSASICCSDQHNFAIGENGA